MRVRITLIATLLVHALGLIGTAHAAPEVVLATDAFEWGPAATDTYLSWTQGSGSNTVYAKPFGGSRMRISEAGASGFNGSIEGTTVTFQQAWFDRNRSDIYRFDVVSQTRTRVGAPVSTRAWEYDPSASGDVLAFARLLRSGERRLILHFDSSDTTRTIAVTTGQNRGLWVGQVSGNWVVYEKTTYARGGWPTACDVFLYDIGTRATTKIANPNGRCQYSPAVDDTGTVFYARSGFGCGLNAELRALPLHGSPTTLVDFPDRVDLAFSTFALEVDASTTDLYFDRGRCATARREGTSDIHKVTWSSP
ncbi:MAG TPA: hypothetical protein VLA82_07850 [Actinomycetota bacterium]|nr:hypothetical protein [Actinomycetota bacterium]